MAEKYNTLVLNKSYIPVYLINSHRCMALLYKDHAHCLDHDYATYDYNQWVGFSTLPRVLDNDYNFINTVDHKIAIPDTIVLTKYNNLPKVDIKFSRENIFHRDKNICQYCGEKFPRAELELEHVIPKAQGGKSTWDNTVAACTECNHFKADRAPWECGMELLAKPKEPRWFSGLSKAVSQPDLRPNWKNFLKFVGVMDKK